MPRPKRKLPKGGLAKIRRLAEKGVTETDIAAALGMDYKTYKRIRDEQPEVQDTLDEARQIEEGKLFGVLFEKAMGGDSTAAMFLLKTRHGYKEGAEIVNSNQMNVQIVLPAALNPKDYEK